VWALLGPFARLRLPSRGHWSPAKARLCEANRLSVPQLSVSTIISPSREADRGNPKHCTSRA
jgi:hypothetical protein